MVSVIAEEVISIVALLGILLPLGYLLVLAVASTRRPVAVPGREPSTRFVIAIPAHDEASVIRATVENMSALHYPADRFSIHIVADHCSDNTAVLARQAGAIVHERNEGPRMGKGAALAWLFLRILENPCDAVVVFDSDTQADPDFLRLMDARLAQGAQVVQGQHIIRNPGSGWFPALAWAMFLIDNRFQNLGRSNLGWSAKNMGDSICLRADVLRRLGWGAGLTEDYQLRQLLLLAGIKMARVKSRQNFERVAIIDPRPLVWSPLPRDTARRREPGLRRGHRGPAGFAAPGLRAGNLPTGCLPRESDAATWHCWMVLCKPTCHPFPL